MKKILILFFSVLLLNITLSAQKKELITVKAGHKILDYFPVSTRYMYSEFTTGRVVLKSGKYSESKFNYNFLLGEIEYIQARDTLTIINKKDLKYIVVTQDTFFYDNGYIEQLRDGSVRVGMKQFIELKEVQNLDTYGVASSGSATNSYGSLPVDGNFYKLSANKDMIFQKTIRYYIATPESGFVIFNKKNMMQLYPQDEDKIKSYLKTNKVNFESLEDLLRLADYIKSL